MSPARPSTGAADGGSDEPTAEAARIRALRIAVIVMSLVLVVGFVTVVARIIYLVSKPSAQASAAAASAQWLPDIALGLPAGASVTSTSLSGNRLAVHYSAPGGGGILVLDLETGRVLSRVKLQPEAAR